MADLNTGLAAVGTLILVLSLLSRPVKRTVLSGPLLAFLAGVLMGPIGLGLLIPSQWGHPEVLLEEAARMTLAIGVMGIALRLPPRFMRARWRSLGWLLGLGMLLMWLISSALAYGLLGLPPVVALLLGAVITPTDPVVATSVVTGPVAEENLPDRVRSTLSAEAGSNDGLAYALVLLPALLLTQPEEAAWGHWIGRVVFWEIGGAVLFGVLAGLATGKALVWSERTRAVEPSSFLAVTLALSLAVVGAAKLLGTDGILAVFAAGLAFDQVVGGKERAEEENVQEAVNQFFTLPIFVLFGLMVPWEGWQTLGWQGPALALAVLLLRRLPVLLALRSLVRPLDSRPDALFAGWFGPVGVSAVFYAMLALRQTGQEAVWPAASIVVCVSLVAHGVSAAPFARLYGRVAGKPPRSG